MGIDARILVKTKVHFTPEQLRHESYLLASALGHDNFFITERHHALELVVGAWEQDGPSVEPRPGEQFIEVNLWSRYYGPGYERGHWPIIRGVLCWFWANHPDCETWYGGDSSGVCVTRFTPKEVAELDNHFYTRGHRPYLGAFTSLKHEKTPVCPWCHELANNCGGGGAQSFWHCTGCGMVFIMDPAGVFQFEKRWDIFKAKEAVRAGLAESAPALNKVRDK